MDKVAFGRRIYNIRREKEMTSDALSDLCDINAVFLRQIENAAKLPSLPTFVNICNALKVSPESLLLDSLEYDSDKPFADLLEKLHMLTPSQLDLVTAVIGTMVEKFNE